MKILVADDDLLSRRLMERMLERNGYEVITAENGREAAEILSGDNSPRLALIDWMMPELDGPGVCRQVRSRHDTRYVYITLLTAKQASKDIVVGLESGADDYLVKPCNSDELMARLRTGIRILDLEDKIVEAREEMRFKATHDALTSLWNRGAVVADFEHELARSRREKGVVSVLICDIDYFKQVNDGYGHQAGDEVLRQVSSRLLSSVRSYDKVGRYGGEEFLVVLSGCDSQLAQKRAEEIRRNVSACPFMTSKGLLSLSVSIGVLTSNDRNSGFSPTQLLNEADRALYHARESGRNCVKVASSLQIDSSLARGSGREQAIS
jgi:diguanylate cyclase (GGDEF)-like protein